MTHPEALRVVAMLTAYFRQELSDETAMLWADGIKGYQLEDAMEAARLLGQANRFMPSLGEFTDAIVEVRNERLRADRPVLPPARSSRYPFAVFLAEHPDMAERVRAFDESPAVMVGARSLIQQTFSKLLKDEIA